MNNQLGNSTVTSTIAPFLAETVFGNVEKDKLLQKAIKFGETLTELDKSTIADNYSLKTSSIINSNMEFREIFWKEFFTWIDMQKKLTTDPLVLAKRLLPINPEGGYYDEAFRNFNKFGFQTVKAFEFYLIDREIEKRYAKESQEAQNEKAKLKNGDLVLIRDKYGKFTYYSSPEVRRALESVKKSSDFLKNLRTAKTGRGTCVISFNPLQIREEGAPEVKSTILDLNKEIWANKRVLLEKHMEKTGIYVDGGLKVDNGVAVGRVVDNKGVKMKLEVSVIKPGKRVYKFTFVDTPTKNFILSEDELQDHFANKKRGALEVFTLVQRKEHRRVALPVGRAIAKPKERARPSEAEVLRAEEKKKGSEPIKAQLESTTPAEPPVAPAIASVTIATDTTIPQLPTGDTLEGVEFTAKHKGPIPAKTSFYAGLNKDEEKIKGARYIPQGDLTDSAPKRKTGGRAGKKNAVFKIMKWYGLAGAGLGGAITGITLFT